MNKTENKPELRFDMVPIAERLKHETEVLKEWFKKDYPESELRVSCDLNGVLFCLSITIEILMGEEVTKELTDDRLYFKSRPIRLVEKDLRNRSLMEGFYKEFQPQLRKQIQGAFNRHYLEQKQRVGLE